MMQSNQNKEILKEKLQIVIELLDQLVLKESFPAYKSLLDDYVSVFESVDSAVGELETNQLNRIFFSTRRLQEAPPKDDELGLLILHAMSDAVQYARHL